MNWRADTAGGEAGEEDQHEEVKHEPKGRGYTATCQASYDLTPGEGEFDPKDWVNLGTSASLQGRHGRLPIPSGHQRVQHPPAL